MSDFFILAGTVLVAVFGVLVSEVQRLRKELETLRVANDYLARRLTGEIFYRTVAYQDPDSDAEVRAVRAEIDRELRDYLHGDFDTNPEAWEKRGNTRSYR